MVDGLKSLIKLPTAEEMEIMRLEDFEKTKKNKNNMSYWLPYVSNIGFNIPETIIIQLPYNTHTWLRSDNYTDETIKDFTKSILDEIEERNIVSEKVFNTDRTLFLKSGTFSNKFDFKTCKLLNIDDVGNQFLNIYYTSMLLGADNSSELVIREFIDSTVEDTIYEGMPLNVEFRVFYDFDKKEIMGIFNYWDTEVMLKNLQGVDLSTFNNKCTSIEVSFDVNKQLVIEELERHIVDCKLEGEWSIDFMLVEDKIYLIDMALAQNSYYYNKVTRV